MNKTWQHIRDIGSKALTIALVCVFVFQPFSPLVTFADGGSSPVGFLDSASCTSFEGWAYDADDSNTSIGIHFYTDINSVHTFLDSTTANGARADVNASQNISGDHGFSFPVPSSLKDGQPHLIYAYGIDLSGGSNTLLSNSPLQISGCTNGNPINTAPSSPSVTIPSSLVEGTTLTFSAVATDPQGDQVAYGFDWNGDTTLDQTELTSYVPSGTSGSLSHIFYTQGNYTVGVYARDAQLTSAVTTIQFTVTAATADPINTAPLAPDVTIPASLVEGATVTFSAVSTDPQGDQVAYGFDWNGDTTLDQTELTSYVPSGTSGSLSHIFYTQGNYTVGVYARDASLTSLVKTIQFTVTAASTGGPNGGGNPINTAPLAPDVTIPASIVEGTTVTFSAASTDPQGDQVAYGFDWNGDTTLDQTELTSYVPSGTSASLSHIFYTPGTYTVGVYARDAQLTSAVTTIQFTVTAAPGTGGPGNTVDYLGSFSINPTTIQSGQSALISWASSNNATLCLASGDWSGYQALSNNGFDTGVQNFAVTTTKTYTLECGNGNASTTRTVTLTINPVNPGGNNNGGNPGGSVATFFATPNPVVSGSTAVLTWTSTNANLCVASGAWLGNQLPSGTYTIPAATVTVSKTDTYSIACGNAFGTTTGVVNLVTNPVTVNPSKDFTISPLSGLSTSESAGQATFTVVLVSAPLADVVLPVMSSNFAEGTTSVTSLVFTPANWAVPQNVVVTGQDDTASDGSIAYSVNVGASVSTDTTWNNIPAKAVSLTNTDNEPVVVPPTGGGGGGGPSSSSGGHSGGGHGPCTGFGCVTVATTTIPVITIPTTSTVVSGPELVCPTTNFITTFMRIGIDNYPNEVRKLQYFLNTYEGAHLVIDGEFNPATEAAVMALQAAHSDEILAPWGVTVPTGIVYITTTRYINRVFCADHPTYTGNESLKDILDTTRIDVPVDNSAQFEGVVGQATTSNSFIANIGGVFGAMTERILDLIKDIPWYQLLILLLILTGCWFIMGIAFKKNVAQEELNMSLIRGSAALAVGSVLNVLNTLSFILNPQWFTDKAGFGLGWLLALDIINLLALILICITTLITLYQKVIRNGISR